jgi:proline iminopeptidase
MTADKRVAVKGAELQTTSRGRGPVCLVLCNLGARPYQRQLPAALDEDSTLVFVDLRGSGLSTGEPAELSFDVLAEDLEAVRVAYGASRVAVLGHSIVGVLAIEYGRRCPATVSHVIAVGAPPHGAIPEISARAAAFFEEDASPDRKAVLRENLARLPPGTPPAQAIFAQTPMRFHDPRFDAAPLYEGAIVKPAMLTHLLGRMTVGWDVTAGPPLAVPTLLAHGRHDYVVPWTLWEPVVPRLPTATLKVFEESGHQPFVEEPERFVAVLRAWRDG